MAKKPMTESIRQRFIKNYPTNGKLWCIKNLNLSDGQVRYYAQKFNLKSRFRNNPESNYSRGSGWRGKKRLDHSTLMKKRNPFKGKKHSKEAKDKMSKWRVNNPVKVFKDTSIELAVEAELKKRNVNYQKQVPLCGVARVDFYLPEYRIVVQADGDYWHNRTEVKERDRKQDAVLNFSGFNVYRFWEHEINKSVAGCIDQIPI